MIIRVLAFIIIVTISYWAFSKAGPAIDALGTAEIKTLITKANEFDGKRVRVRGNMKGGAAILGVGGYKLEQDGAQVIIVTSRGTPELGSQVTVEGIFKQLVAVDGVQAAVIFEKK